MSFKYAFNDRTNDPKDVMIVINRWWTLDNHGQCEWHLFWSMIDFSRSDRSLIGAYFISDKKKFFLLRLGGRNRWWNLIFKRPKIPSLVLKILLRSKIGATSFWFLLVLLNGLSIQPRIAQNSVSNTNGTSGDFYI